MSLLNIPTSQELTADGVALEDHAIAKLQALANQILDRANGIKLEIVEGGFQLVVPPSK